ncbi:branched-chain amino acid ABC transporter permease/ATP-binding protein [Aeromicrobium sp.]|uniref:branched-chain amino acid ABC transporter permease/ATP-binding protein n=1 Tax=Aeromicrobium sp. TaxID=1871063 RepID=UPI002FC6A9B7
MSQVVQFILLGLAAGSLYALAAHGLVLVYKSSGVLNLAQGAVGMLGAFLFYRVGDDHNWSTPVRFALGIGVPALVNCAIHLLVMRRLRTASPLVRLVAGLGVLFLLLSVATSMFGDAGTSVVSPLPTTIRRPFGNDVIISEDRLWLMGIAIVMTAALWAIYKFSAFGRQTEAVAENPRAAAALGYSPDRIAAVNWAVGGALAGLAAILIAPVLLLQPAALSLIILRALAAALVGRFQSFWITLAGALTIGVTESLLARFVAHDGFFERFTNSEGLLFGYFSGQSVSRSVAFLIIVFAVAIGGRALPLRGELLDRLPAVGDGRVQTKLVLPAFVVAVALVLTVPDVWATAISSSLAMALILLSIVVVSGYVGQLSLAQVALAGMGAWIAGRLVDATSLPMLAAVLVGVCLTVIVGTVVALPATRARGVNLAVLTFGLAVCIVELVLANPALTGGLEGTRVPGLTAFGATIDPFEQPGRYAAATLLVLVFALLIVANLRRSGTGRRLLAVRGNERAASALGIDVSRTKLYAFALGSAIAALGGILLAFREHTVAFASFGTVNSIQSVVLATIGGIGYLLGPLMGAMLAPGGLGDQITASLGLSGNLVDMLSGALLLAVVLTNPNGMAHTPSRLMSRSKKKTSFQILLDRDDAIAPDRPPKSLIVESLAVRFGGVKAVDGVDFRVAPGEVLGLIGPNGAGKTTVLDAITGFVPSGGDVTLGEELISRMSTHARAQRGLQRSFQSLELFDDLTVAENLLVACEVRSPMSGVSDLARPAVPRLSPSARQAIKDFDLESVLDESPRELSFGQRRLVAIARAVASTPSLLLLDEPAAGLGESESAELGVLIRHQASQRGIGVVIIEHDVELIMSICDRILVLDAGKVIASGTPSEVTTDPRVISAYLGAAPVKGTL